MNRTIKVAIVSLLACLIAVSVGTVAAVNGNQDGDVNRAEVRQQFKDENCCEAEVDPQQQQYTTQEQLRDGTCTQTGETCEPTQQRTQERLRDGTCNDGETATNQPQESNQEQLREQHREGDCVENADTEKSTQEATQERTQTRQQYRYGCTE